MLLQIQDPIYSNPPTSVDFIAVIADTQNDFIAKYITDNDNGYEQCGNDTYSIFRLIENSSSCYHLSSPLSP